MQRVVLLARVSTDSEDQINSLETQRIQFSEFVKDNNLSISPVGVFCNRRKERIISNNGIFAEEGISGKSMKNREATKYLLSLAPMKQFDTVVVKNVPRFGRNSKEVQMNLEILEKHGIGVFFQDIKVNSMDRSKNFIIQLFASLAEEESNAKSISVQVGIRRAQKDGKFTSIAPYGYELVNGYLRINENQSAIVCFIYYLYLRHGYGTGKIARILNAEKVPTQKGAKWAQITVSRVLDNPIYTGLQIQHITQIRNFKTEQRDEIPEKDWIKHQFEHLRIIDNETFRLVQINKQERLEKFGRIEFEQKKYIVDDEIRLQTLRKVSRGTGRHSNQHLLSNLLFCANCGGALKRKKRHGKGKELGYEWSCRINDMYGKDRCAYRNSFPEDEIIETIKFNIEAYKESVETADDYFVDQYIELYRNRMNEIGTFEEIKFQMDELVDQRELNFKLLNEKIINVSEYKQRNDSIQSKINELESMQNKLSTIEYEIENIRLRDDDFRRFLLQLDINNMDNTLLRRVIDKVTIKTYEQDEFPELAEVEPTYPKVIFVEWKFMDTNLNQLSRDHFNFEKDYESKQ